MNARVEPFLPDCPPDTTYEINAEVQLASERARDAQGEWREAQYRRLRAAERAERLALELKAAEERAEARVMREAAAQAARAGKLARASAERVAAARAAILARCEAEQKRIRAAARVERLERELRNRVEAAARAEDARALAVRTAPPASRSKLGRYAVVAAIGLFTGAGVAALAPVAADFSKVPEQPPAAVLGEAPGEALKLRPSYRLSDPAPR